MSIVQRCSFLLVGLGVVLISLQHILYENWKETTISITLFLGGMVINNIGLLLLLWCRHNRNKPVVCSTRRSIRERPFWDCFPPN